MFAAAFLFSTGGAAIKACHMTAWQVAGFRSGVAAIALFAMLPAARRRPSPPALAAACAYAATLICFVLATKLTTSANAIFLQSTAPVYLLLLGPLLLHERIGRTDLIVFLAIGAGMLLLLGGGLGGHAAGNAIAAASGVTWACTLAGLRWLATHERGSAPETPVAWGNVMAFLICLPFVSPVRGDVTSVAIVVYLGVFQIALAYICLTRSVRRLAAMEAATLLLIEPVFNPVWTWITQGEEPGIAAVAGGALISFAALAGAYWNTRWNR